MRTTLFIIAITLSISCSDNSTNNTINSNYGEYIGYKYIYEDSSHQTGYIEKFPNGIGDEYKLVLSDSYFAWGFSFQDEIDTIYGHWIDGVFIHRDTISYMRWETEIWIENNVNDSINIIMKNHEHSFSIDDSFYDVTRTWGFRCKK